MTRCRVPLLVLARMLGHSSPQTTMYRYSRVVNQAGVGAFLSSGGGSLLTTLRPQREMEWNGILKLVKWMKFEHAPPHYEWLTIDANVFSATCRVGMVRFGPTTNAQMSTPSITRLYMFRRSEASVFIQENLTQGAS
jgi:hypothetical protein